MKVVYIHGAKASPSSFNFIRSHFHGYEDIALDYDSELGFYNNLEAMVEMLRHEGDIFLVAHSLGGIYALHLAERLGASVKGAVTLSTPYGGSEIATLLSWNPLFYRSRLLREIQPRSVPIVNASEIRVSIPWVNLVTTTGRSSLMPEANDGVVTLRSMRSRKDIQLFDIKRNHFEVLLDHTPVLVIKEMLESITPHLQR